MIGALFGLIFYVVGLVVGLIYGTIGLVFYVVFGLAGYVMSWMDIYFMWFAALIMLYWVEYIDPWETKQRKDEVITFFPTIARLVDGGEAIAVTIHGWLYHPKRDTNLRRAILAGLKRTMPAAADAAETLMLESRLSAFIVDNRRGKRVSIQFLSSSENPGAHTLSTLSKRNGHFSEEIVIPRNQASLISYQQPHSRFPNPRWVRFASVLEDEQQTVFKGEALLLEDVGVSVISDIDDTIRISMVCDKRKLVLYSFLKRLRAIPGMSQLYRNWQAEFGARFHYVSGGPWQFYESINEFFELSDFPKGTVHLRHLRIKDSSLFAFISSPHYAKKRLIEPILRQFPKRKFIFVGDSGEKDPEIYAELAAMYPDQVKAIFIRRAPEKKAVAVVVSETVTAKAAVDNKGEDLAKSESVAVVNENEDEEEGRSEEASMIAASCASEDEDEDDDNNSSNPSAAATGGRRGSVAKSVRNSGSVSTSNLSTDTNVKEESGEEEEDADEGHRTGTRVVVEVREEDRECLAEMSDERKAREWKRFAPIFAPLRGRTLCRVFTCPSEIADFTLDDILHSRANSGEDAVEWEMVRSIEQAAFEAALKAEETKSDREAKSESEEDQERGHADVERVEDDGEPHHRDEQESQEVGEEEQSTSEVASVSEKVEQGGEEEEEKAPKLENEEGREDEKEEGGAHVNGEASKEKEEEGEGQQETTGDVVVRRTDSEEDAEWEKIGSDKEDAL